MNIHVRHAITTCIMAIVILATSACTELPLFNIKEPQDIDYWIKQQQYGKAISELERQSRMHPSEQLEKQLTSIKGKALEYDRATANSALAQQTQDNWEKAFATLNKGMQNYPDGIQLQKAKQTLIHRQTLRKKQLMAQVLLVKAEWLISNYNMQREIVRIDPDNYIAESNLQEADSQLSDIASKLYDYGMHAKSNNDLDLADHCLTMSNRIRPQKKTRKAMDEVASMQEARRRQQLERENRQLLVDIQQALQKPDLALARKLLQQTGKTEGMEKTHPELASLRLALDSAIAAQVNALLEQGDTLYSNEKIDQAKKIWESAQALDPNNKDIQERIQRVERVLEKLEQLKSKMK